VGTDGPNAAAEIGQIVLDHLWRKIGNVLEGGGDLESPEGTRVGRPGGGRMPAGIPVGEEGITASVRVIALP
jgi:hypothetical protein